MDADTLPPTFVKLPHLPLPLQENALPSDRGVPITHSSSDLCLQDGQGQPWWNRELRSRSGPWLEVVPPPATTDGTTTTATPHLHPGPASCPFGRGLQAPLAHLLIEFPWVCPLQGLKLGMERMRGRAPRAFHSLFPRTVQFEEVRSL